MKQINVLILTILFTQQTMAQRYTFQWVNIPDSISEMLNQEYGTPDVGAGKNVYNMMVRDDFEFDKGIYSYKGMGPHFPQKLFILNDSLYLFKTSSYKVNEYITEWQSYLKNNKLEEKRIVDYSVAILNYLANVNNIAWESFTDYVSYCINKIAELTPNESDSIWMKILSQCESIAHDNSCPSETYTMKEIENESLYGQWYFQTVIHKEKTDDGDELLQRTCEEVPLIHFNLNGVGTYYEEGKEQRFKWYREKSELHIRNISRIFFNKKRLTLIIKNRFLHNNKMFMELEDCEGDMYVLSRKIH